MNTNYKHTQFKPKKIRTKRNTQLGSYKNLQIVLDLRNSLWPYMMNLII